MINLDISIGIDADFWKQEAFDKADWGFINYLVGPNATGKSRFLEHISMESEYNLKFLDFRRSLTAQSCFYSDSLAKYANNFIEKLETEKYFKNKLDDVQKNNLKIDLISFCKNSTRGVSFNHNEGNYLEVFEKLNSNKKLKNKVNNFLLKFFCKEISFWESTFTSSELPYLGLDITNINENKKFSLVKWESLGIKQLIILLTYIYDETIDILIIDEPELNLHPSLQLHLMQEIRSQAGDFNKDKSKKVFFIATHSTFIIESINKEDVLLYFKDKNKFPFVLDIHKTDSDINNFLLRADKQFLFTSNPVFVEGITDKIIFSAILKKLNIKGSFFLTAGGKEEIYYYYKLCKNLNINAKFILDLDAFLESKIKNDVLSVSELGAEYSEFINLIGASKKERLDTLKNPDKENIPEKILNEFNKKGVYFLSKGELEDYFSIKKGIKKASETANKIIDGLEIDKELEILIK